jgi:hypothetical protein
MKKLILAFTLGLAPFLCQAFESLFDNPNLIRESPQVQIMKTWTCKVILGGTQVVGTQVLETEEVSEETKAFFCQGDAAAYLEANVVIPSGCDLDHTEWTSTDVFTMYYYGGLYCNESKIKSIAFPVYTGAEIDTQGVSCPPDSAPSYNYPRDEDNDGEIDACYEPAQLDREDDCKSNSPAEFLNIPVTTSAGCYPTQNESVCKYEAVQINNVEVYAMDLEGSCYSDLDTPSLDGSPVPFPTSSDDLCESWGNNGAVCPENSNEICDSDGNCPQGCGSVNDVFVCYDNDNDGDGLPDYIDPDIDGDGIENFEDPDEDGDGLFNVNDDDTPNGNNIREGTSNAGGTSNVEVEVNVDLTPVVNELKDINDSISKTTVELQTEPTEGLTGFYESEYEDGIEGIWENFSAGIQTTEMNSFLETFKNVPSGGSMDYNMCFDLGAMGNYGCGDLAANPIIWAAIRIFILVTAGFLCRRIVFGG